MDINSLDLFSTILLSVLMSIISIMISIERLPISTMLINFLIFPRETYFLYLKIKNNIAMKEIVNMGRSKKSKLGLKYLSIVLTKKINPKK